MPALRLVLAALFALGLFAAAPSMAQEQARPAPAAAAPGSAQAAIDSARASLDQIEATLERPLGEAELTELRNRLDPLRDSLGNALSTIEPRLAEARDRLSQLGPKPADNAPPEAPEARQHRDEQTRAVAELDGRVRALKVQQVRIEQIAERITDRRRQLFTAQLFERSIPIVDPRFWVQLTDALPTLGRSIQFLAEDWWHHLADIAGAGRLLVALAVGMLAALFLFWAYRQARRYGLYATPADIPASKLALVGAAIRTALERSLVLPILTGVPLLIVQNFELTLPRAQPIIGALFTAVVIIAVTRGVMQAVMAPGRRPIAW